MIKSVKCDHRNDMIKSVKCDRRNDMIKSVKLTDSIYCTSESTEDIKARPNQTKPPVRVEYLLGRIIQTSTSSTRATPVLGHSFFILHNPRADSSSQTSAEKYQLAKPEKSVFWLCCRHNPSPSVSNRSEGVYVGYQTKRVSTSLVTLC